MKAYTLMKNGLKESTSIYYRIAFCYYELGKVSKSIMFLEKARELYSENNMDSMAYSIYNFLAVSYIKMGCLQSAKVLLDKCFIKAESDKNSTDIGKVLNNYGYLYRKGDKKDVAISYLNRALEHHKIGSIMHLEMLYQKIWCLIELDCPLSCVDLLAEGKALSENNERFAMCFRSLESLVFADMDSYKNFIEGTALPYFIENKLNHVAIDFCEYLIERQRKKGVVFNKKTMQMIEVVYNMRKEMMEGGVFEC